MILFVTQMYMFPQEPVNYKRKEVHKMWRDRNGGTENASNKNNNNSRSSDDDDDDDDADKNRNNNGVFTNEGAAGERARSGTGETVAHGFR